MLSIVIIGKNEAKNLPNLYASLKGINIAHEILYIDSASSDESVMVSKQYYANVIELENSTYLCASAGRFIGTQKAKYEWILYLDGDMELEGEFIEFLNQKKFLNFTNTAGFVGYYEYIYHDNTSKQNRLLQPKNEIVKHFGGGVLLKKQAVLKAGNWNSSVVANEEIDLYARMQKNGFFVYGLDIKMLKHKAKKISNIHTLISLFYPLNRYFYGFGQVLVSQYKHKNLLYFLKLKRYTFAYLLVLILSCLNACFLAFLPLLFLIVSVKKRWHYNILYLSELVKLPFGIFSYPNFTPKIKQKRKKFGFLSHQDMNLYLFRLPVMKALLKCGHEVYAIYPKSEINEKFEQHGIKVVNYDIIRESLNPLKELQAIKNIYNCIKNLNLDVLHTFTAKPNIYGTIAGKKAQIPYIFNLVEGLGSFYLEDNPKSTLVRFVMEKLYKNTFKHCDGAIFVNSDDPKYMLKQGLICQEKITIIKSVGIDTEEFDIKKTKPKDLILLRQELNIQNKQVVLMVARAIFHKGVREFCQACEIVKKSYENVEFLLVGGLDKGNVSCVSEEFLENSQIKWLNHRNDIFNLVALSDIFVLPSYKEGVPRTLLEAASMSKPIVTTDTTGCKEVVENEQNGFLVPVRNSEILAQKILVLLQNKNLRDQMGENGRKKAIDEFDIKNIIKQYLDFYQNKTPFLT